MGAGLPGENRFGVRMRGSGPRFSVVQDPIAALRRQHGLTQAGDEGLETMRIPQQKQQGELFERT